MIESPESTTTPRPRAIYWIASLTLAGILLYYSLRGIEWLRVWNILKGANPSIVALVLVIMTCALVMRALRWRVLLSADREVPRSLAFWATAAGYLGNNVLPARAGEFVRTLMISTRTGMSKAFVLTTAFSERVVDAIVLITISATVLVTLQQKPGWLADAAKPFAVIGFAGVAAIALLPILEKFWFRLLARLPLPVRFRQPVEHILAKALQGIRSFHDRGRLLRFLLYTAVIWCADAVVAIVGAYAIGISITPPVAFLLVAGLGLGSALPSTPGYVGIYQFVAVSVLVPFGYSRTDAIAYILLFQALNYLVILSWGAIGLAQRKKA